MASSIETAVGGLNFYQPGANFMSKKLGVKIPPGRISPNFIKNFPLTFLLEDRFLVDLGEIYSLLGLMKLAPDFKMLLRLKDKWHLGITN